MKSTACRPSFRSERIDPLSSPEIEVDDRRGGERSVTLHALEHHGSWGFESIVPETFDAEDRSRTGRGNGGYHARE